MNLYLIKRTDRPGYDEFDAIVVAAPTAFAAIRTHPRKAVTWSEAQSDWLDSVGEPAVYDGWAHPNNLSITQIGTAHSDCVPGVVLSSFRAG